MSETLDPLQSLMGRGYQHGFVTDIESDTVPLGSTKMWCVSSRARKASRLFSRSGV